jgi:hypothetical protein
VARSREPRLARSAPFTMSVGWCRPRRPPRLQLGAFRPLGGSLPQAGRSADPGRRLRLGRRYVSLAFYTGATLVRFLLLRSRPSGERLMPVRFSTSVVVLAGAGRVPLQHSVRAAARALAGLELRARRPA